MKPRVVFMGTPDFACAILDSLMKCPVEVVGVVSQPDKKVGRDQQIRETPVHKRANEYLIPVVQPEKIKLDFQAVLDFQPDLIVTCAYGQLVPQEVLDCPKYGCINVHASLLPKYRGGAPIHYAIIKGESQSGVTLMQMVKKMDAGDCIATKTVDIGPNDTTEILHDRLMEAGSCLLQESLMDYLNGKIIPVAQNEKEVSFAWNITKEQEQIDFSKSAHEIYNQIRGLISWPVGYGIVNKQKMKFWAAQLQSQTTNQISGTILGFNEQGMQVAAGGQVLTLSEIQLEGKKRISAKEFYHGKGKTLLGFVFEQVSK